MIAVRACARTFQPTSIKVEFDQTNIDRFVEVKLSALLHGSIAGQAMIMQPALELVIDNVVTTTASPTLHSDGAVIIADFELPGYDGSDLIVGLRRVRSGQWYVAAIATCEQLEVPSDDVVLMIALLGDDRFAYRAG